MHFVISGTVLPQERKDGGGYGQHMLVEFLSVHSHMLYKYRMCSKGTLAVMEKDGLNAMGG